MSNYRMIALDMDGTVLNSRKEIDEITTKAIHKALDAGKEVVFCTGRSFSEMEEILAEFPEMKYLSGESGGMAFDIQNKKVLHSTSFSQEEIDTVVKHMEGIDYMPFMMAGGKSISNKRLLEDPEHYQVAHFTTLLKKACTMVDDLISKQKEEGFTVEKFNLYHTSPQEREQTLKRLQALNLPLEMVYSDISSLELTPKGVDKALGLRYLSEVTGISMEEIIMVGDADNDLPALKACGLGIAMGNANENVLAVAQAKVADNDHWGVAEAIEQYLLQE